MEATKSPEPRHSASEVSNHYACQKLVKTWIDHPDLPSSQAIPTIHTKLLDGIVEYEGKGLTPQSPGVYRNTNPEMEGKPSNFLVNSGDVIPLMREYVSDLDGVLRSEPISPTTKLEETVHHAAWAYYAFLRIHPFLDGNGRIGRMIIKRIMMGKGYKDIIFQKSGADGKARNAHIDALEAVDSSGNLAHLEMYLLKELRLRYTEESAESRDIRFEIDHAMEVKRKEIEFQSSQRGIGSIWEPFSNIEIQGAHPEAQQAA